jgi:hypothetical protein
MPAAVHVCSMLAATVSLRNGDALLVANERAAVVYVFSVLAAIVA